MQIKAALKGLSHRHETSKRRKQRTVPVRIWEDRTLGHEKVNKARRSLHSLQFDDKGQESETHVHIALARKHGSLS